MIAKVSAMIAVWAAAILVDFSGFVPGIINSDDAMLALRIYYCLGCAIFFLPALFLTWYYPLTKQKHKELRMELESQNK
jgi:Na+/melibiose symporter-like transporter